MKYFRKDASDRGRFGKVESLVFALSEKEVNRYWLAKCYLLLGDSYFEQEDYEQAYAVYNSIFTANDLDAQLKDLAKEKKKQAKDKMK